MQEEAAQKTDASLRAVIDGQNTTFDLNGKRWSCS
jgi:hypothetical protein